MNFSIIFKRTTFELLTKKAFPSAREYNDFWFVLRAGIVIIVFGW